jgi:hypothetical protein
MQYEFRPIETWPGKPTTNRQRARFRARYSDTLKLLESELDHLDARSAVIQIALEREDIRQDGMPRASASPKWPGIIVSFHSKHGPLSYPCDTFADWQDNLRAIALSLKALRDVARYGVTKTGEQYKGWAKLTGPSMTAEDAAVFIAKHAALRLIRPPVSSPLFRDWLKMAYRAAAMNLHPDRGGNAADFAKLDEMRAFLEKQCP